MRLRHPHPVQQHCMLRTYFPMNGEDTPPKSRVHEVVCRNLGRHPPGVLDLVPWRTGLTLSLVLPGRQECGGDLALPCRPPGQASADRFERVGKFSWPTFDAWDKWREKRIDFPVDAGAA